MPLLEYLTEDASNLTVLVWTVCALALLVAAGMLAGSLLRRRAGAAAAGQQTPNALTHVAEAADAPPVWDGLTRSFGFLVPVTDGASSWWQLVRLAHVRANWFDPTPPETIYVRHQSDRDASGLFRGYEMPLPYQRLQLLVEQRGQNAEPMFAYVPLVLAPSLARRTLYIVAPAVGDLLQQPPAYTLRTVTDIKAAVQQQRVIMADEYGLEKP